MKTKFLLITLIFYFFCIKNTSAQVEKERAILQNTIDSFEIEKNWNGFIQTNIDLLKTYQGTPDFHEGKILGESAYLTIKTHAPEFRKECGNLLYHIGLTSPYPYNEKSALKRFSDAKILVRSQEFVDTLLLSDIYNNMGLASLQLNDYKNAKYYLLKSNELVKGNPNYKGFDTFQWMSYNWSSAIISSDTTFGEFGEITDLIYSAVSANPPFFNSGDTEKYIILLGANYLYLEEVYRKNGDYEKSIATIERGLKGMLNGIWRTQLDLNFVEFFYRLGLFYFELEEYEQSSFYFTKTIGLILDFSELIELNPELKFKENYYRNHLLPECNYFVGKNNIHLKEWEKVSEYFEEALTYIGEDSDLDDLEIKIFTGFSEYHFNKNNALNDTFFLEIFEYIDTSILKNQSIVEAKNISIPSKVNYNFEKAKIYQWLLRDHQKAIDILYDNFKIIPTDQYPSLRAETHLRIAKYYFTYFDNPEFEYMDSVFYHNQQALISVCKTFKDADFFQLPPLEDILDMPIVQDILIHKADMMLEHISLFMDFDWIKFFNEYGQTHKVEGIHVFFNSIIEQLDGVIAVTDLADSFHEKQLRRTSFLRAGNQKRIVEKSTEFYRSGVFATHFNYYLSDRFSYLNKGFYYAQKMKGQRLQLNEMKNLAKSQVKKNQGFFEYERRLKTEITTLENHLFAIENERDSIGSNKEKRMFETTMNLFGMKRQFELLQREMESDNPDFAQMKYQFFSETYQGIQETLEADELLIEFVITLNDIFVITISKQGKPKFTKIENAGNILFWLKEMKTLLENSTLQRKSSRISFIKKSNNLYQYLLQPIETQLANKKRLIIIGDSYTNYLPFEILLKTDEIKPFQDLDFLIKSHEISYHYSSTLFVDARRKGLGEENGIYAFAPVYDDRNVSPTKKRNLLSSASYRAFDVDGYFRVLPDSEKEVKAIMRLFEEKNNSKNNVLALRKATNETAFKANLKKPFQFIHIAGHSFANIVQPKFSGIACYQIPNYGFEDGTLYSSEIDNINIKADLVTLSSCESGLGKLDESDGLIGLNRAFLQAGTSNVVFSLWKIYDKVSADVMIEFYSNILTGNNYSTSLRAAKLNLLEKEETASPHFWSPYLLIGR